MKAEEHGESIIADGVGSGVENVGVTSRWIAPRVVIHFVVEECVEGVVMLGLGLGLDDLGRGREIEGLDLDVGGRGEEVEGVGGRIEVEF